MAEHAERLALLVTDQLPSLTLADAIRLAGYQLEMVCTMEAAARQLGRRVPELVVAGPFRDSRGFELLLMRLHDAGTDVVVVTDDDGHWALATQLGFLVRRERASSH